MILMKKKISNVTFSSAEKLACILKYVETPTERISLRFLMPISIEKKKMAVEASKWRSKGGQHRRGFHTHTINFRMLEVVSRKNYYHHWILHTLFDIFSVQHCDWIKFHSKNSVRITKHFWIKVKKLVNFDHQYLWF